MSKAYENNNTMAISIYATLIIITFTVYLYLADKHKKQEIYEPRDHHNTYLSTSKREVYISEPGKEGIRPRKIYIDDVPRNNNNLTFTQGFVKE